MGCKLITKSHREADACMKGLRYEGLSALCA